LLITARESYLTTSSPLTTDTCHQHSPDRCKIY
jgi:hypothetical protein